MLGKAAVSWSPSLQTVLCVTFAISGLSDRARMHMSGVVHELAMRGACFCCGTLLRCSKYRAFNATSLTSCSFLQFPGSCSGFVGATPGPKVTSLRLRSDPLGVQAVPWSVKARF